MDLEECAQSNLDYLNVDNNDFESHILNYYCIKDVEKYMLEGYD